ncbi:MAG: L-serine ammonia-lyase, iron-sulfur-dependent, subunit alpha, partial [Clostridia bacterium]|nr:L-serine ammonia-lyase, iron-sulfur-dependent, subunit alpha [Clostridia bacterium]
IFIKTHTGKNSSRMAAVCCAAVAAGGASCGVAFMRGDDAACLSRILQTVLGTVAGLFCDGAKADCATKVAMAIHSAFQIMLVAEAGRAADEFNGIVGVTVEDTIKNFYRIQREGMSNIMETLYNIEVDKNHIC